MEGLSERQYAARVGLSRGAIQKAKTAGRLVLNVDGSVNAEASDVRRAETTDGLACSGRQGFTAPKTSLSCWLTRMKVVRLESSLSWRAPT